MNWIIASQVGVKFLVVAYSHTVTHTLLVLMVVLRCSRGVVPREGGSSSGFAPLKGAHGQPHPAAAAAAFKQTGTCHWAQLCEEDTIQRAYM
jgi:hypothetical protein